MKFSFGLAAAVAASASALKIQLFNNPQCLVTLPTFPTGSGLYGNQIITAYDNVCLPYDATPYIISESNASHARVLSYWNATFPPNCVQQGARNPDWQWNPFWIPRDPTACTFLFNDKYPGTDGTNVFGKALPETQTGATLVTGPPASQWFRYTVYVGTDCTTPVNRAFVTAPYNPPFVPQTQWVPVDSATATDCSLFSHGTGDNGLAYTLFNAKIAFRNANTVNVTLYAINPASPLTCSDQMMLVNKPDLRIDNGATCQVITIGSGSQALAGSLRVWAVRDQNNRDPTSGASAVGAGLSSVLAVSLAMLVLAKMRE